MATDGWLCCFCGKEIEVRDPDPCRVVVTTHDGKDQWWSCHAACFKDRLAKDPPIFEPVHF